MIRRFLREQLDGVLTLARTRRSFLLYVAGLCAVCLALNAVYPARVAADESQGATAPELEGTWRVRVIPLSGDAPFVALHTFARGGAMMESNQIGPFQTPGHGVWRRIGPHSFGFTFESLLFTPDGKFVGTLRVNEVDQLDSAGQTKTGRGALTLLDPAGNIVFRGGDATTIGTRMTVQAP